MPSTFPDIHAFASLAVQPGFAPMEAKSVDELPTDAGWQFEPKWDGFRCLAFKAGKTVALQAKSGKPLTRYFPEVAANLARIRIDSFVLDGELMIAAGDSYAFDALQMRVHPAASRIAKLSVDTPALLAAFDILVAPRGRDLTAEPLHERRERLDAFCAAHADEHGVLLGVATDDRATAEGWLAEGGTTFDGVVAKRIDAPYRSGERAMLKVKRRRTADCVVGGFRYATGSKDVGSLLLGLYDGDRLHHVGFTSNMPKEERGALTKRLEHLIEPPGFNENVPGAPSRWASARSAEWQPLRPELVVEVRFDQVTSRRFRHGTSFVRWRPDKAPQQCTFTQIEG